MGARQIVVCPSQMIVWARVKLLYHVPASEVDDVYEERGVLGYCTNAPPLQAIHTTTTPRRLLLLLFLSQSKVFQVSSFSGELRASVRQARDGLFGLEEEGEEDDWVIG